MIKKLFAKRKLLVLILSDASVLLWILHIIFANSENKVKIAILVPVMAVLSYCAVKGVLWFLSKRELDRYSDAVTLFVLFLGALLFVTELEYFITQFPNGVSTSLGIGVGLIESGFEEIKKIVDGDIKDK